MKNYLYSLVIFFSAASMSAQALSYGPVVGNTFYFADNSSGVYNIIIDKNSAIHLGGYMEYNFTNTIGVKTEMLFNKREGRYSNLFGNQSTSFDFSFLDITPSFKYDFGQEYRKGFYMIVGPKFSFVTKVTSESEAVKDDFESFLYGVHLGFGSRVYKYIDLQTKFEYDIKPIATFVEDNRTKFFGVNFSLYVDVERLINSK